MLDQKKVGEFIATLRKSKGLTQSALADLLCVTHQAVSKWENGASLPDPEVLIALRGVFGVPVDSILDGRMPPERATSSASMPGAAGREENPELDTITDEAIVVRPGYQTFSSPAIAGLCTIHGTAHFEAEFRADSVEVIGTGRFDESLTANTLAVSGAADVDRQVQADAISITGSLSAGSISCHSLANCGQTNCGGGMKADSLTNTGCISIGGGVEADILANMGTMNVGGGGRASSVKNTGRLTVGGGISSDSFRSIGDLTVGGGLGADSIEMSGPFHIGGGIAATSVSVALPIGNCDACWITTDHLIVEKSTDRPSGVVKVREIRADHAELENVHADIARVQAGKVGDGCKIARLECGPEVEVLPGAEVGETVRLPGD